MRALGRLSHCCSPSREERRRAGVCGPRGLLGAGRVSAVGAGAHELMLTVMRDGCSSVPSAPSGPGSPTATERRVAAELSGGCPSARRGTRAGGAVSPQQLQASEQKGVFSPGCEGT